MAARAPGHTPYSMNDGPALSQDPHSLGPQQGILHLVYTKQEGSVHRMDIGYPGYRWVVNETSHVSVFLELMDGRNPGRSA